MVDYQQLSDIDLVNLMRKVELNLIELENTYKVNKNKLTDALDQLRNEVRKRVLEKGALKSELGSYGLVKKTQISVANVELFKEWVLSNNQLDLVRFEPHKVNMKKWIKENEDIPTGINYAHFDEVQWRG